MLITSPSLAGLSQAAYKIDLNLILANSDTFIKSLLPEGIAFAIKHGGCGGTATLIEGFSQWGGTVAGALKN